MIMGSMGDVIGLDDPYGSLITDVPGDDFKKLGYNLGDKVTVQIAAKSVVVPYVKTFMGVPVGESLLYIDSRGRVGIAVNQGNYATKFHIVPPTKDFYSSQRIRRVVKNKTSRYWPVSSSNTLVSFAADLHFAAAGQTIDGRLCLVAASTEIAHARSCNCVRRAHRGGSRI